MGVNRTPKTPSSGARPSLAPRTYAPRKRAKNGEKRERLKSNGGVPVPSLMTAEQHAQLAKEQREWEEKNAVRVAKQSLARRIEKELDAAGIKK